MKLQDLSSIKFRGLTEEGEWVYGVPVQIKYDYYTVNYIVEMPIEPLGAYLSLSDDDGFTEVDPNSISQFTGIRDINGVEVYLGHKVRPKQGRNTPKEGTVIYSTKAARFGVRDGFGKIYSLIGCEVIGNSFEGDKQ